MTLSDAAGRSLTSENDFNLLVEEIKSCPKCSKLCQSRTQAVPGNGTTDSELLFVGEAPGRNEDNSGIPFCGASGNLLNEMLASINLTREQVFVTNIIKCRPPNNRDPESEEVNNCLPYLERQMALIQPILIITLGRHALGHFLPGLAISQIHGQAKRREGKTILPLYHPAVAIYDSSKKEMLWRDFSKIPQLLIKIRGELKSFTQEQKTLF